MSSIISPSSISSTRSIKKSPTSTDLDLFGIKKVYPTAGNEWYVNHASPWSGDPGLRFVNAPLETNTSQNVDGSWQLSGDPAVRMEVFSPSPAERWLNVEMTAYVKYHTAATQYAHVQYARGGGHHTLDTNDQFCDAGTYKMQYMNDGGVSMFKEVNHPAYVPVDAFTSGVIAPISGRWLGFKSVFYNYTVSSGTTYVVMEQHIDNNADTSGNLTPSNNWVKYNERVDVGGWHTFETDWKNNCSGCVTNTARQRDEILICPGSEQHPTAGQGDHVSGRNMVAFRSDNDNWSWKNLSVREIVPPNTMPMTLQISGGGETAPPSWVSLYSGSSLRIGFSITSTTNPLHGKVIRMIKVSMKGSSALASGTLRARIYNPQATNIYTFPLGMSCQNLKISGEASGTFRDYSFWAISGSYAMESGSRFAITYQAGNVNDTLDVRVSDTDTIPGQQLVTYMTAFSGNTAKDLVTQVWTY